MRASTNTIRRHGMQLLRVHHPGWARLYSCMLRGPFHDRSSGVPFSTIKFEIQGTALSTKFLVHLLNLAIEGFAAVASVWET